MARNKKSKMINRPNCIVSTRELVMANTMPVDEYFDELIHQITLNL
jgi:hypothetical protein